MVNGVQSADPRYSLTKRQNMRNYFSVCFSNNQVKVLIAQPLDKRCSNGCFSVISPLAKKK
ncbi:hypothetical protein B1148_01260 [Enterococcus faecium]|nr:hypothetical protein B1148_01260 [Enterococcus faecium]